MPLKSSRTINLVLTFVFFSLLTGACSRDEQTLQLSDLSDDEYTYIERIIILERAKALALNDRDQGDVLLDSLLIAWGDSAETQTGHMAPTDAIRSQAVHRLLEQILTAEKDSLLLSPETILLTAPLDQYPLLNPQEDEEPSDH